MTPQRQEPGPTLAALAAALDGESAGGTVADELALIRHADELNRLSQARLHELVAAARSNNVPWQAIGDVLGVSRQAAFKRFGGTSTTAHEGDDMTQPTIDLFERTTSVFESLEAGDYAAVKAHMTYTCSRVLTKRKVMEVWQNVNAETGRLEECADTTVQTPDGRSSLGQLANRHFLGGAVVQTTLRHEAGEWIGRIAYNGAGKITGLVIAVPGSQNLPF